MKCSILTDQAVLSLVGAGRLFQQCLTLATGRGWLAMPFRLAVIAGGVLVLAITIGSGVAAGYAATCTVPSAEYPTIQSAASDPACREIQILPGVYYENITVDHSTVIRGVGKEYDPCNRRDHEYGDASAVILDAQPGGVAGTGFLVNADEVTIEGLTVRHGTIGIDVAASGFRGRGLCVFGQRGLGNDSSNIRIAGDRSTVEHSELYSANGSGVQITSGDTHHIRRNFSHNQGRDCFEAHADNVTLYANRGEVCLSMGIRSDGVNVRILDNHLRLVDRGVEHRGDGVIIRGNKTSSTDNHCYAVEGTSNNALVEGNRGEICASAGIRVETATGTTVRSNHIEHTGRGPCLTVGAASVNPLFEGNTARGCGSDGIAINGGDQNPKVLNNTISDVNQAGILFRCDDCTGARIEGNRVSRTLRARNGIDILANGPGLLVRRNVVEDAAGFAFLLNMPDGRVQDNQALRNGTTFLFSSFPRAGFLIRGTANLVERNLAQDGADDGFLVEDGADGNTLRKNRAIGNVKDGFHVLAGASNTRLDSNHALRNQAEGIQNDGTNTLLTNNVARDNRRGSPPGPPARGGDCAGSLGTENGASAGNVCADGSNFDSVAEVD